MTAYYVQFAVIREVQVEADDDLQAEQEAFQSLSLDDQGAAIAMCVLNTTDETGDAQLGDAGLGGALAYDDAAKNWKLCREAFNAIDREWVA